MAKMKDFARRVKAEIEQLMSEIAIDIRTKPLTAKMIRPLGTLQGFAVEFGYGGLLETLDACSKDETDINEASLKVLLDRMAKRFQIVARTDGGYNPNEHEPSNVAYLKLAERVCEEWNILMLAAGRQQECVKSAYEGLFGLSSRKFITSKGNHLGCLKLHEFFWSEDLIPIEVVAALNQFHIDKKRGAAVTPSHVCLSPAEMQARTEAGKPKSISKTDLKVLLSHSAAAAAYYEAISLGSQDEIIALRKRELEELVARPDFVPGYTYRDASNKNLIAGGFLTSLVDPRVLDEGRLTLYGFANLLSTKLTNLDEWENFVNAINDDDFDSIVLPCVNDTPNSAVVDAANFSAFVNDKAWYISAVPMPANNTTELTDEYNRLVKERFTHNRAVIYLLAQLYGRKRSLEGEFNDFVGKTIGVGCDRDIKNYAKKILDTWVRSEFFPNRLPEFLTEKRCTIHESALKGRLGVLINKARDLNNSTVEVLANAVNKLYDTNSDDWEAKMPECMTNELLSYIKSCGTLAKCIVMKCHYKQGDHLHNKAVLYLFAESYWRERELIGDSNSFFGYTMTQKRDALVAFKNFLRSEFPPNQFKEYLRSINQPEHEAVMRNVSSMNSLQSILVSQAEKVCSPKFYEVVVEQPASYISIPSLGFKW
jgi:hypothetical protein